MARKARARAASGVYYIRLESVSPLFLESEDYEYLIKILLIEKESDFLEVYAFCFIDCFAHFVLKEGLSGVSGNLMHIKSKYAAYYNSKYLKSGSLFKGRFFSKPLEENADILHFVRLTNRAPLTFGYKLQFEGSSYPLYFKKNELLSSNEITSFFKSAADFKIFIEKDDEKTEEPETDGNSAGDAEMRRLKKEIRAIFKEVEPSELENLSDNQYIILIKRIKQITGATNGQIAKILKLDERDIADI